MFLVTLFAAVALGSSLPKIRDQFDAASMAAIKPIEPIPLDLALSFNQNPSMISHVNADTVASPPMPKKTEKLPLQKPIRSFEDERPIPDVLSKSADFEFFEPQPRVVPELTGLIESAIPSGDDFEFFNFNEGGGAVTNPAATYLEGGNFDKIAAPKCRLSDCTGPLPNDGSVMIDTPSKKGKACYQTFVPMNECTNNKGYPMGMLCSICCDCTAAFVREMKKTHGFKIGYDGN